MAFPVGWGKKHKIVIDNTKVGGGIDFIDIPIVLVTANFLTSAFDNSDNGGGDIRFSSDAAGVTRLACEIVRWVIGTDEAVVWVKIPTLDTGADTTIYVWYDKTGEIQPAVDAAYGREAVWSNGYQGVWHAESTSWVDSSGNNYDLTNNGAAAVAGLNGGGMDFELTESDYADIADASAPNLEIAGAQTWLTWYKPESIITNDSFMNRRVGAPNIDQRLIKFSTIVQFRLAGLTTNESVSTGSVLANGVQSMITGIFDSVNSLLKVFHNTAKTELTASGTPTDIGGAFAIGRSGGFAADYLDGVISEAWIINGSRTDEWVTTMYNNQSSPGTFATASSASDIKKLAGVLQANVKKVIGVTNANVKKLLGVTN